MESTLSDVDEDTWGGPPLRVLDTRMAAAEVAAVAVDGGGRASGTHGPLDLVPAPGGAKRLHKFNRYLAVECTERRIADKSYTHFRTTAITHNSQKIPFNYIAELCSSLYL